MKNSTQQTKKVEEERSEYKDTCYEIREAIFFFPDGMLGPFSSYSEGDEERIIIFL